MGIQNLLPQLKSIMDPKHISEYRGKRVGIDAYAWLHRAAYTCSQELCLNEPTDKWLHWCMERCRMLQRAGVIPVLVFDGGRLPEKDKTERGRRELREANLRKAMDFLNAGQRDAAYKLFQKSVNITPTIARRFIQELKMHRIEFINAPYEADAQLAFLSRSEYIVSVITEDSDLLVFGCPRVFYKMDANGHGCEVKLKSLSANTDLSFRDWTHEMFQQMCIFAGCDYLESLPNVGIKKAHNYIKQHRIYDKAIRRIRLDGKTTVPSTYDRDFELAFLTFKHQRVYDPATKKLVHLTPVDDDFATRFPDSSFLGPELPDDIACGIAEGRLDPDTHQPFVSVRPPAAFPASLPPPIAASSSAAAAARGYSPPPPAADGLSGWSKKPSTILDHMQPAAAPLVFAQRTQHSAVHSRAASAHVVSSTQGHHAHAAAAASSLSSTQRKVFDVCGALIQDEETMRAVAAIPASLKQDFRPPRRHALQDTTNLSASQPNATPAKSASAHYRGHPSTFPQKGRSSAHNRLEMFDQFAYQGGARSSSYSHSNGRSAIVERPEYEEDEVAEGDDFGFSREDEAAEQALEAQDDDELDVDEYAARPQIALPTSLAPAKPRMNFLSRRQPVAAARPGPSGFFSPPEVARSNSPRYLAPPAAVPMTFTSPPMDQSPSPPPPSARVLTSKHFTRPPQVRLVAPVAAAASSSSALPLAYAPPSRIPDASSFLRAPLAREQPATFASVVEDEDDGRIDMEADEEEVEAIEPAPVAQSRRKGGKRASASGSDEISKRFKSSLLGPGRLTLPRLPMRSSTAPAVTASIFDEYRFQPQPTQQQSDANMHDAAAVSVDEPSPSPPERNDSPPPTYLGRSAAAAAPFHKLTVQPGLPRSSAAPLFSPVRSSVPQPYSYPQYYFSPPSGGTQSPRSPTPSPAADPSPSPSPPDGFLVSQPIVPCVSVIAGFSSQPSSDDEQEEEQHEAPAEEERPALFLPASSGLAGHARTEAAAQTQQPIFRSAYFGSAFVRTPQPIRAS